MDTNKCLFAISFMSVNAKILMYGIFIRCTLAKLFYLNVTFLKGFLSASALPIELLAADRSVF